MITKTDFQLGGASALVQYIKRDDQQQVPVKDHTGQELNQGELEKFIETSEEYGMERHFIISPDPDAEFDPSEVDRNVRKVMNDWREGHRGTQYVYAVHGHNDRAHAHVAVTGRKDALRMNKQDVMEFRERAREAFDEPERLAERQKLPDKQAHAAPQPATATADEAATAQREYSTTAEEPSPESTADPETSNGGLFSDLFGDGEPEPSPEPARTPGESASGDADADAEADPGPGGHGALESAIFGATRVAAEELSTGDQTDDEDDRDRGPDSAAEQQDDAEAESETEPTADNEPDAEYDYW